MIKSRFFLLFVILLVMFTPVASYSFDLGNLVNDLKFKMFQDKKESQPIEEDSNLTNVADGNEKLVSKEKELPATMEDIQAEIRSGNYEDAIKSIDLYESNASDDVKPFLIYLKGQVASYYLKDKNKALEYYNQCASDFPESRYGRLSVEKVEFLKKGTITEATLKEKISKTREEMDGLIAELDDTSIFNFIKKSRLKKKIEELQKKYVSQKELLASFKESPESLVDQYMGKGNNSEKKLGRISSDLVSSKKMARCLRDGYNVRMSPWGKRVGKLKKGELVEVVGTKKDDKGNLWYKVKSDNFEGYCYNKGLSVVKSRDGSTAGRIDSGASFKRGRCIKDEYNVRMAPWGKIVGQIHRGDVVEILGSKKKNGQTWYRIKFGDLEGYCYYKGISLIGVNDDNVVAMPQDEFQSWIVKNLFKILYANGGDPLELSDIKLFNFFDRSPVLSAQFPEVIEKRDIKEMKKIVKGLMRMLYYTPLRKALNDPLAKKDYQKAYKIYRQKYTKNYDDPSIYNFKENAVPTIIINIPAKKLRLYRDGLLILDVDIVPGRDHMEGFKNTKTRVGRYTLKSWHECYTTKDYPVKWSDNCWKGAFGKYCAKVGPNSHGQHIHGTTGPEWLGNIPINYAPGSHGCTRVANKNITKIHKLAPVGTKVIKTYCIHEKNVKHGFFGESFTTDVYSNIYKYKVGSISDGWYIPSAGVFINHNEPKDAIR